MRLSCNCFIWGRFNKLTNYGTLLQASRGPNLLMQVSIEFSIATLNELLPHYHFSSDSAPKNFFPDSELPDENWLGMKEDKLLFCGVWVIVLHWRYKEAGKAMGYVNCFKIRLRWEVKNKLVRNLLFCYALSGPPLFEPSPFSKLHSFKKVQTLFPSMLCPKVVLDLTYKWLIF